MSKSPPAWSLGGMTIILVPNTALLGKSLIGHTIPKLVKQDFTLAPNIKRWKHIGIFG
jgi:hypothetical protein